MRIVSLHLIQGITEDYNLGVIYLAIELAQGSALKRQETGLFIYKF